MTAMDAPKADMEVDYLILGGGSAGCVLADRLTENGRHEVLLVEAGPPDRNPFIHVPAGGMNFIREITSRDGRNTLLKLLPLYLLFRGGAAERFPHASVLSGPFKVSIIEAGTQQFQVEAVGQIWLQRVHGEALHPHAAAPAQVRTGARGARQCPVHGAGTGARPLRQGQGLTR